MITRNIMYTGVIRNASHENGSHMVRLTQEVNCLICWELKEQCQDDESASWNILWYMYNGLEHLAIERAVHEKDRLEKEELERMEAEELIKHINF